MLIERSSSILLFLDDKIGKISKTGVECNAYESTLSHIHLLKKRLIDYDTEKLLDTLNRLHKDDADKLVTLFPAKCSGLVHWMPDLKKDISVAPHTLQNEVKTIDIKITAQDMFYLKAGPPMYKTNSVMIDDLHVSLSNIDSIHLKQFFNKSSNQN